jgi:hypothetical protein
MKAKLLTKMGRLRLLSISFLLTVLLLTGSSFAQTIRYAKPVATGTGNGSSWANASADIQLLISKSAANDQIWVAGGTYLPTRSANDSLTITVANRLNAFVLKADVQLYGGFAGVETDFTQRNITANLTILSGDFNGDDIYDGSGALTGNYGENAAHVVIAAGTIGNASINGFTIKGGNTFLTSDGQAPITVNYAPVTSTEGGGIYCVNTGPTGPSLEVLVVTGNRAELTGGGIHNTNMNGDMEGVNVTANYCAGSGGGVYNFNSGPLMEQIDVENNSAGLNGGGVCNLNSAPTYYNSIVKGNTAVGNGGGIYNSSSNIKSANLLVADNSATDGGGIYYTGISAVITNATVANNTASEEGGGVYVTSGGVTVHNSIFWGNTAATDKTVFYDNSGGTVAYSIMQPNEGTTWGSDMGVDGGNNSVADPFFINAAGGDYRLQPNSQGVNTGNNAYFDAGQTPDLAFINTDLDNNLRFVGTVDKGVYELQSACGTITIWDGNAWSAGAPTNNTFAAYITADYDSAANGEVSACSLTVSGGATVVNSGDNFTVEGLVTVNSGTLTLENNANLLQTDNVSNVGNISVIKNSSDLYYLDYTLWSSPTGGSQTLKQFSPGTLDARFYVYNTTLDAYSNYTSASGILGNPNSEAFDLAKGYLIRMPDGLPDTGTSVFTGTFNGVPNNGDITIGLNTTGSGYNAVGNPYPSPINLQAFIAENSASLDDGTLYFWRKTNDPLASSYSTATSTLFVANSTDASSGEVYFSSHLASSWVINSGQGFFVKAAASATLLNFTNDMRAADNNGQFFKQSVPADVDEVSALWLNLTNDTGSFAQTAIGYSADATNGIDYGKDGKLLGDGANAIYTMADETPLIIQTKAGFTATDVVPVSFQVATAGSYTIALDHVKGLMEPSTLDIFLTDTSNGNIQGLKNGSYTFTADAGTFDGRFTITYADTALGLNNPQADENGIAVFKKEGSLYINSTGANLKSVDIFDLQGRKVFTQTDINTTQNVISRPLPQQQVLIVKVTTQDNTVTDRKIIN